jgi:hypothetical protein
MPLLKKTIILFLALLPFNNVSAQKETTNELQEIVKDILYNAYSNNDFSNQEALNKLDSIENSTNSYAKKAKIITLSIHLLSESDTNYKKLIDKHLKLGLMSVYNSNSELAISSALKAKNIALKYNDKDKLAESQFRLGTAYAYYTNNELGFDELYFAKNHFEKNVDSNYKVLSTIYPFISNYYFNKSIPDSAAIFFKKGYSLAIEKNDSSSALNVLMPYTNNLLNNFPNNSKKIDSCIKEISLLVGSSNSYEVKLSKKIIDIKYQLVVKNQFNIKKELDTLKKLIGDNTYLRSFLFELQQLYYEKTENFEKALQNKKDWDKLSNKIKQKPYQSVNLNLNNDLNTLQNELVKVKSQKKAAQEKNRLNLIIIISLSILIILLFFCSLFGLQKQKIKQTIFTRTNR